jgi:hypothetical protein
MKMRLVEVMNQVEIAKESVSKVISDHDRRPSLKGVSGEESKQVAKRGTPSSSTKSTAVAEIKRAEEIRAVQQLDNRNNKREEINEDDRDDDLEDTLAVWLLQQKRSVTVRKKPTGRGRASDEDAGVQQSNISEKQKFKNNNSDEDVVQDDAKIAMYRTADGPSRKEGRKLNNEFEDGFDSAVEEEFTSPYHEDEDFDNRPLRGKYMMGGDDVEVVGMQCMLAEALMGGDDGEDDD